MTDSTLDARSDDVGAGRAIEAAAARLILAAETGVPAWPVRDLIGSDDVQTAYAVQELVTRARLAGGARVVGRKVGLTSEAVQTQIGVQQPDFGVLFADMAYDSGAQVRADAVLQPRAEAEIAFILGADLAEGDVGYDQVRAAIAYALPAIEICGSRVRDWDISFADTVADNASAGAYVLGAQPVDLTEFEPRDVVMTMTIDGEEVSTGTGAACLGDPVKAVVWLAQKSRELGEPLRAGQVVLSGALGPMRPITAGNRVRAVVEPLGAVEFTVSEES